MDFAAAPDSFQPPVHIQDRTDKSKLALPGPKKRLSAGVPCGSMSAQLARADRRQVINRGGAKAKAFGRMRRQKTTLISPVDGRGIFIESTLLSSEAEQSFGMNYAPKNASISPAFLGEKILAVIRDAHAMQSIECDQLVEALRHMLPQSHGVTTLLSLSDRQGAKIGDVIISLAAWRADA